jgi:hypothetical protein
LSDGSETSLFAESEVISRLKFLRFEPESGEVTNFSTQEATIKVNVPKLTENPSISVKDIEEEDFKPL